MPEKNANEVPRPLREQYEKGLVAFQRQNYDYAISLLTEVLNKEPGFFDCRQALRATQFKKAGEKGGFFKKVWGGASASPLIAKGQMALRNNPLEALQFAEQILTSDPNSSAGHKLLADAALGAGFPKAALLSLEILYKASPNDREIARELGQAYMLTDQPQRAEAVYSELLKNNPHDAEVSQEMKNAVARTTMASGGYENIAGGTGSYRDILKDKDEAVSMEQANREVKTSEVADQLIKDYTERLTAEPTNSRHMRSLAELYVQKKEYDQALSFYRQIIDVANAPDPEVEKIMVELNARKLDQEASLLDASAPDFETKSQDLKRRREELVLIEAKRRVEKYPNDLQIRFELAQLYFKVGKVSEAIQEFQKAQNNPHRRIQSLNYLGQCFAQRGMNDLAARTFQNALKEKVGFDEEKKELIYHLGVVLEKMGKVEEAIEQFKQIYEVDIGYRDVAAKVDTYYASKQG